MNAQTTQQKFARNTEKNYENLKTNTNKPRKVYTEKPQYSCEVLCGRVSPCGNTACSNYRGHKKA